MIIDAKKGEISPTCFDCVNSVISGGCYPTSTDPGVPLMAECNINDAGIRDLGDRLEWDENLLPKECGYFMPRPVGKCSVCEKMIDAPAWNWPLISFSVTFDEYLCSCSPECKAVLDAKIEKEIKELMYD